jgi:hypothetical protein
VAEEQRLSDEYFRVPASPRIWNYWMGGKDNYSIDREVGDAVIAVYPGIRDTAVQSRQFLVRVARFLAEEGIRQFLDIGTGFPTEPNTHQIVRSVAPDARVVYLDNDPVVLAHARALLVSTSTEGATDYLDADVHNPDQIIAQARELLNFDEPIGVQFFGVLGHVADFDQARAIVARVMESVPSGSYLALRDSTNTSKAYQEALEMYSAAGAVPYSLRSPAQIAQLFDGLRLVDPGVVTVSQWRPGPATEMGAVQPVDNYGGVAERP